MRILYICHNHPDLHAGGTEIFARNLFQEVRRHGDTEALFLACTNDLHRERRPGTLFQTIGRDAGELLLWAGHFDRFHLSQTDSHAVALELEALLREFRPDVVHFHHALLIGVEALALVRRVVPRARIVFTLHDYYPICLNDGQMVTVGDGALCAAATVDGCRRCFPEIEPSQFLLRDRFLRHHFKLVDRFVAPSAFLRQRYIEWGLAPWRIELVANGQPAEKAAPHRDLTGDGRRNRFGFFGHINRFKGATLAVAAVSLLEQRGQSDFTLDIYGSASFQTEEFRARFQAEVDAAAPRVRFHGGYRREELATLMASIDWVLVPSLWWENAPLVIQEAFLHRRPVICADIGGMAEMVRDGIDGLHFRAGDADSLAVRLEEAMTSEGLWERLVGNLPVVRSVGDSARDHLALYRRLIADVPRNASAGSIEPDQSAQRAVRCTKHMTPAEGVTP